MIVFLTYTFIILHILKKFGLHAYRIIYYNTVFLFLTCLTHHNLCNDFMDSMCLFPFYVKRFETMYIDDSFESWKIKIS